MKEVVGKLDVRLVDLVNEHHGRLWLREGCSKRAKPNILPASDTSLSPNLLSTLDSVVHIQPLLGFTGTLDVPGMQGAPKCLCQD